MNRFVRPSAAWLCAAAVAATFSLCARPGTQLAAQQPQTGAYGAELLNERPVRWSLAAPDSAILEGDTAQLVLSADVDDGWYLYALTQPAGGPQPLQILLAEGVGLLPAGEISESKPRVYPDRTFNLFTARWWWRTTATG